MYSPIQKKRILEIAHDSIELYFNKQEYKMDSSLFPDQVFSEKRASFVTISKDDNLRGCIGSILAYRPLWKDVSQNAVHAAFHDPRFNPLDKNEMPFIDLDVSVLTVPALKECKTFEELQKNIKPFEDGVIIQLGSFCSTFLPQVWEDIPDFKKFFEQLCLKASLPVNFYITHTNELQISTYQAEIINQKTIK